jgi:hypothetical protein
MAFAQSGDGSPGNRFAGKTRTYSVPRSLRLNQWALGGERTVNSGFVALDKPGGRIVYRFHARDVHLVMGPAMRKSPARTAC